MRTVITGSMVLLLLFPFAALADDAGKDCITVSGRGMGGVTSFYGGSENFDYFPVKFFSTAPDEVVVSSNVSVSYELTR